MRLKWLVFLVFFGFSLQIFGESQSYSSPEEVARAFMEDMQKADFEHIYTLNAYSYDEIVDKLDAGALLHRAQTLIMSQNMGSTLPRAYGPLIKMNILGRYSTQLKMLISSILLPEEFDDYLSAMPQYLNDEDLIDLYLTSLDVRRLKKLELVRMDYVLPDIQDSPRFLENLERQKASYGFDDKKEYTLLYQREDEYFDGAMTFVKYGDSWYIDGLEGLLQNASSSGVAGPLSGLREYLNLYKLEN